MPGAVARHTGRERDAQPSQNRPLPAGMTPARERSHMVLCAGVAVVAWLRPGAATPITVMLGAMGAVAAPVLSHCPDEPSAVSTAPVDPSPTTSR